MPKKKNETTIRSSVAEYLTVDASIGDDPVSIEMRCEDKKLIVNPCNFVMGEHI